MLDVDSLRVFEKVASLKSFTAAPGGYLNFLHPWPGETPPPGDGGTRDDYAV
jgi:hypothetical protein